jgi:membrane associated rhomboid family serine protease
VTGRVLTGTHAGLNQSGSRRPLLTVAVGVATLAMSVAALFDPALMGLLTRDLAQLRAGQWWRSASPLLVQSDGWGQLGFNLLGLGIVGAALERRVGRPCWALVYLLGGAGSIALTSAWNPDATGGGSSDAVAALLGAFTVLLAIEGRRGRGDWPAQLYAVFFAAYLTTLDLTGLVPSIIAGNAAIILLVAARRAVSAAALSRACLILVLLGGVLMTIAHDGHGVGILAGTTVAGLVLARRWLLARAGRSRAIVDLGLGVLSVWALTLLTLVAWVRLLGVELAVVGTGSTRTEVGWSSVSVVAVVAFLLAWVTLRLLQRWLPRAASRAWLSMCSIVAVGSLAGPLIVADGPTNRAALICLHMVCAATVMTHLAPSHGAAAPFDQHSGEIPPTDSEAHHDRPA